MEMTNELRDYTRSLDPKRLSDSEVEYLLDAMLLLDPDCGPKPTTRTGKRVAAATYVRFMQGDTTLPGALPAPTWRTGHAR